MPIFEIYVPGINLHSIFFYLCGCTWFTSTNKEWIPRGDFEHVALLQTKPIELISNSIMIIVGDTITYGQSDHIS